MFESAVAALMLPDLRFDFAGVCVRGLVRRGVPNHFSFESCWPVRVRTLLTMFVGQTASLSVLLHVHLSVSLTHVIGDAVGLEDGVRT